MSQQRRDIELMALVGKKLKQLRADKALSQDTVYIDTDIHIARLETGKYNVSISTLNALCKYYSITLQEFFSDGFDNARKEASSEPA